MDTEMSTTLYNILSAAEAEFLKQGFRSASLRSIVKAAGVTTGAFYGYFESKEQIFDALVKEQYDAILSMYRSVLQSFQALPAQQQQSDMMLYTSQEVSRMTDYVYDHLTAFKLMLCSSEGTKYEHFIDDMASLDVQATHDFQKSMEGLGLEVQSVNEILEHMLISGMFTAYFELVIHDIPRADADLYVDQLLTFYSAGWQRLMGY